MQKRILCFGDSNTWGYIPTGGRYDEHTRWPMRLGELLGPGYAVVEEGFHGRTCVMDDPVEGGFKSAVRYLPPCLMSHNPLDQVLVMLGSNDAKRRFGLTPMTIGQSMAQVVRTIKSYGADELGNPPHIIIIAPPPFLDNLMETRHAECFGEQAIAVTRDLVPELQRRGLFRTAGNAPTANDGDPRQGQQLSVKGRSLSASGSEVPQLA